MPSTLVVHQYRHLVRKRISSSLINCQLINPHKGKNLTVKMAMYIQIRNI